MKITKKDVEYVAKLARLSVGEGEKEEMAGQLSRIIDHIEKLNQLNTDQIEPTSHVLDLKNVLREDVVNDSLFPRNNLEGAPDQEKGYYKVPKII